MPREQKVDQEDIKVHGRNFTVTRIPTATSGSWFTVHDACEVWGAVAIDDLSGKVIGWRNPPADIPNTKPGAFKREVEKAIRKAFGIPVQFP
ncbi:hypothetical protein ES703_56262 [subsurface metagenome]